MGQINKRSQVVLVDGNDVSDAMSNARYTSAETDSDFVSFADAAAGGGRDYTFSGTLVQDAATGTLWDEIWSNAGSEVPIVIRPYGNVTPTVAQPHFSATAVITEPDGDLLGGDADASTTARQTVEIAWPLTGKPTKVTS